MRPTLTMILYNSSKWPLLVLSLALLGLLVKVHQPQAAEPVVHHQVVQRETALLAGGCFWGMEEIIRKIPGVLSTTVGYSDGITADPTYEQVCTGKTGHAETVQIIFDSNLLSYTVLLDYFFRMHDPTTLNRQHNDIGTQYRSAIFYTDEEQKHTAEKVKLQWENSKKFDRPITTEIVPAKTFYRAEAYHQNYLLKHPDGYTCHYLRDE